jgi:Cdc6-like AAA superfamily ATPase
MTTSYGDSLIQRELTVRRAFSPSAPIKKRDLFAGRLEQLKSVAGALSEPGQHAVIFGERGVGKTSLATMCADVVAPGRGIRKAVKINCQSSDDFNSIWRKVFGEIALVSQVPAFGFGKGSRQIVISSATQYLSHVKEVTPDNICVGMRLLTEKASLAIFLDEFDRVTDPKAHRYFADTLKTLSDEIRPVTIVLVGVADNVDELVKEHASVQRSIVQVHMPRMSDSELADIITNGLATVGMDAEKAAVDHITMLSQGLPHYTHLLAQNAASSAVLENSDTVRLADVESAIETAVNGAQETIRDLFYQATSSNRKNMYKQILLACACCPTDEKGFFTEAAVRATLSVIMHKSYGMPQFARHLNALSEKRGPILKKERRAQQTKYRFIDPLVQPYITMCGLRDNLIDSHVLRRPEGL